MRIRPIDFTASDLTIEPIEIAKYDRVRCNGSPELAYGRHRGPARPDVKQAAVLILFQRYSSQWHIILTKRSSKLGDHAGQISFPGGRIEQNESPWMAAVRETEEELGVLLPKLTPIGAIRPIYVFASHHWVRPFLAMQHNDLDFNPNRDEVETVISMPLPHLVASSPTLRPIVRGTYQFLAPHIEYQEHAVWGATAILLQDVKALLEAGELRILD